MSIRHCIRAALGIFIVGVLPAAAQQPSPSVADGRPVPSSFSVFVQGRPAGSEQVSVTRSDDGWTITSSGRLGPPLNILTRQLSIRYDQNWKPLELTLDATVNGQVQTVHTTIRGGTATSEINVGGQTQVVTIGTLAELLLPNPFFAAYEALAARLRTEPRGTVIPAYVPGSPIPLSFLVGQSANLRIETSQRTIDATRTRLTVSSSPGTPTVDMDLWADSNGRLLHLSAPSQGVEVVREDIATVGARQVTVFRSNDEPVRVAANGFTLSGTISKPTSAPAPRLPAVVLVGGDAATDRDELVFDIPIFGQLADALADAGFVALRYDKRGVGQSGGRPEAATLADYAEDARAAVKFLSDRKDVDPKRVAMIGYGEGGPVAMLAAGREKRATALVLLAAPGLTGAEFNLAQARHTADRSNKSEAEKTATVELQRKIQQAVLTGSGWDQVLAYRQQADTPWFQSFLAYDPAKVMPDIRQPLLIVQGALDKQVDPANADRLKAMAEARKNRSPVQLTTIPGVNHLLVPATTGEADEYPALSDKRVAPAVSQAIVAWLQATFAK